MSAPLPPVSVSTSPRSRIGPRWPLTIGPIVTGVGFLRLVRVDPTASYWTSVMPGMVVIAVGMIADPQQAEAIVASGRADAVALARSVLDDPNWPHHAAIVLGAPEALPKQYERAAKSAWPGYELSHGQA